MEFILAIVVVVIAVTGLGFGTAYQRKYGPRKKYALGCDGKECECVVKRCTNENN